MTSLQSLIKAFGGLINYAVGLLAGIALLVFLWGLAKFILHIGGGKEGKVEEGKNIMKWGLLSLFVMTSVWGIVFFFQRQLGLPDAQQGILPSRGNLPRPGNSPQPGNIPSGPIIIPGSNLQYLGPSL